MSDTFEQSPQHLAALTVERIFALTLCKMTTQREETTAHNAKRKGTKQ
jgi:hypothetical protein